MKTKMDEQNKRDEKLKWKKKMDEKLKWMNTTYLQPIVMCQCKLYLFTTKRFTSIETLPVHLQEVCSHWELKHYLFISKKYVPIGNWNNMKPHILKNISHCFLFEFSLSNLLRLRSFLPLEEENCIFPPIST
jgi:hypothetical protein